MPGGVTFLAATGDGGSGSQGSTTITTAYPASSPNVVAVGGTSLTVSGSSPNYTWGNEIAWGNGDSTTPNNGSGSYGGGGGGVSVYESQPSYQQGAVGTTLATGNGTYSSNHRTYPDISCEANPLDGVAVYDSWDFGAWTPWAVKLREEPASPARWSQE